jgi:hypothetical protein
MTETVNGWANYETWNVALWIQNEFKFYSVALACGDYCEFLAAIADSNVGLTTPDGVPWFSSAINHAEINSMIEAF